MGILQEAKEYVQHDIVPTLKPNIVGFFQVKLLTVYRKVAEIELLLVDMKTKAMLKSFGVKVISAGRAGIVDMESRTNLVPKEMQQHLPNQTTDHQFQVRIIGVGEKEAEIELSLIDPNTMEIALSFGSKTIVPGKTITLEGLEIKITATSEGFKL